MDVTMSSMPRDHADVSDGRPPIFVADNRHVPDGFVIEVTDEPHVGVFVHEEFGNLRRPVVRATTFPVLAVVAVNGIAATWRHHRPIGLHS